MATLERDGVLLHHEATGEGPVVLLTHGYGASAVMFERPLPGYRVVAWDVRGHGETKAPPDPAAYTAAACLDDLVALLDVYGAPRAVVGGHSMGGYLSMLFQLRHPERVRALILMATGPGFRREEGRQEWNTMAEGFAIDVETHGVAGLKQSRETGAYAHGDAAGLALAARGILTQHDARVIDRLGDIDVPALVIVGERDVRFHAAAHHMADRLPRAQLAVIPGAGHAPNISQPQAYDATVLAFLDGLDGPDGNMTAFADELEEWLAATWDPDLSLREWRELLVEGRWACPSWPVEWYGRGLGEDAERALAHGLGEAGAPGLPPGAGMNLAAPTLLAHGADDLKARFLRPTLVGALTWCQLFSEPGSGSDLAGLTTHAVLDGDEWVVNGQKVWSTSAHHADLGLLLARTDWDVTKHAGITYFVLPMQQPGVEVRPLRQMNGYASFNEVFLSDARIPRHDVVGPLGQGWSAALTTLAVERRHFARTMQSPRRFPGTGRALVEADHEAGEHYRVYEWYPQRSGRADLVVERARATGGDRDPLRRQGVAAVLSQQRINEWTSARAQAAAALGRPVGADGSVAKLAATALARAAADAHSDLGGADGLLTGADAPLGGVVSEVLLSVPAVSIAGGTDEIQRNIVGERNLGLPREPQVDRDVPFRSVARNTR